MAASLDGSSASLLSCSRQASASGCGESPSGGEATPSGEVPPALGAQSDSMVSLYLSDSDSSEQNDAEGGGAGGGAAGGEASWCQAPPQGDFPAPPLQCPLPPTVTRAHGPPRVKARAPARMGGVAFASRLATSIPRHDLDGRTALARRTSLEESAHVQAPGDAGGYGGPTIKPLIDLPLQIARLRLLAELRKTNREASSEYNSDEASDDIDDETDDDDE